MWCSCKTAATKCAVSLLIAFPVMVVVGAVTHSLVGHGGSVPLPLVDVDVGAAGAWALCVAVGDAVRRAVVHAL
jgi:hypothetical protein